MATDQNIKVHKKSSAHCMIWNFSPKSFSRKRCQLRLHESVGSLGLLYGAMAKQNLGTSLLDSLSLLFIVFDEHFFCIAWYPCIYFRLLYVERMWHICVFAVVAATNMGWNSKHPWQGCFGRPQGGCPHHRHHIHHYTLYHSHSFIFWKSSSSNSSVCLSRTNSVVQCQHRI